MATMILVHGAAHGAWCWKKVLPLLNTSGWNVIAPDLPGHGEDQSPIATVTMDRYVDTVCRVLTSQKEKSVLVGHSMGGAVVSMATEAMPQSVAHVIYVSGFLPKPGQTVGELLNTDPDSQLAEAFDLSEDNSTITVKPDAIAEAVYNGCTPEDTAWAISRLRPQAVAPMFAPLEVTRERFGSVPRSAVVCAEDRSLSAEFQRQMYTEAHCVRLLELPSGHAPFLSMPDKLSSALVELAKA